jgi:urea transport system permease protein
LKSYATHSFAEQWPYILGGLFIFATLFMPKGLIGVPAQLMALKNKFMRKPVAATPAIPAEAAALEPVIKE